MVSRIRSKFVQTITSKHYLTQSQKIAKMARNARQANFISKEMLTWLRFLHFYSIEKRSWQCFDLSARRSNPSSAICFFGDNREWLTKWDDDVLAGCHIWLTRSQRERSKTFFLSRPTIETSLLRFPVNISIEVGLNPTLLVSVNGFSTWRPDFFIYEAKQLGGTFLSKTLLI